MLRVIFWLIVAAIVVAAAWYLAGLTGTVTVGLYGYSVTVATSLAVVAVVALVAMLMLALGIVWWLVTIPHRVAVRGERRRQARGDRAVTRTLVALAAGEDGNARREAARARRLLGDTPQTLLLAAEAGRLAQRDDEAIDLYKQLAQRDDAALLGLRGLFRQAVNRQSWDEAAAIARQAEAVHPGGSWLREERAQLAVRTGNWAQALQLAPGDEAQATYATAAAEALIDPSEGMRQAKRAWLDHPGFAPAALAYARRLRAAGKEAKVLEVIRHAWRDGPVPDLADFALVPIKDATARAREAARIAGTAASHVESHLLVARESIAAGQYVEARKHLDAVRAAGINQRRLWLLQADLEAAAGGDTEAARQAQRDAFAHAAAADPDPAWRCEACGAEHAHWLPLCPVCQTAGKISWGVPKVRTPALIEAPGVPVGG